MKLVELLARELAEWPEDAQVGMQDPDPDHTIWFLERNHGEIEFEKGGWRCHGSNFDILISRPSCLASDYDTAIVGREEWEGECKRISQPQAEEVEVNKFCTGEKCSATAENIAHSQQCQLEHEMAYTGFKIDQIDGPIKWRDTVNELDAYIEEFTRERESLINRLVLEGFALIPAMTAVMGVADVDMSDWRNWKAGDIVECLTDSYNGVYTKGFQYKVKAVNRTDFDVHDNHGENSTCSWDDDDCEGLRFVSRP